MIYKFESEEKIVALDPLKFMEAGYLLFSYETDMSQSVQLKRNIEISLVEVLPEYRRRGIASDMIRFLIDNNPDVVWFSLWTGREIEEVEGLDLYMKLGFKRLVYHEDYYAPGIGTSYFARRVSGRN